MRAFIASFNVSGQPAITLPWGTNGGLPIGAQRVARPGADRLLFTAARLV